MLCLALLCCARDILTRFVINGTLQVASDSNIRQALAGGAGKTFNLAAMTAPEVRALCEAVIHHPTLKAKVGPCWLTA